MPQENEIFLIFCIYSAHPTNQNDSSDTLDLGWVHGEIKFIQASNGTTLWGHSIYYRGFGTSIGLTRRAIEKEET